MRWLIIGIVGMALVVACVSPASAGPVFAASSGAEGDSHAKTVGVEHGLFKGAIEVTLWTVLVFVLLLLVLHRTAWKDIREGLDKRERGIAADKAAADQARKEADELRTKLQQEMAKVNDQIRTMMEKARQDAQATAAEELARGKAELQAERERLQRELRISSDHALQEVWQQGAQLATLISSKVVRKNLGYEEHRALLDEALSEFRGAAKNRLQDIESARA